MGGLSSTSGVYLPTCGPYIGTDDEIKEVTNALDNPLSESLQKYLKEVKGAVLETIEPPSQRFHRYYETFRPNIDSLKRTTETFVEELHIGLACHKAHPLEYKPHECSLKMLDAYVPRGPSGKENGVYYALDFGGSNFRVLRVEMINGKTNTKSRKASLFEYKTDLPKGLLDPKASATMMFDFFAETAESFMQECGDLSADRRFPLGFTFSYPCSLRGLTCAQLIVWTKGFETGRDTDDPVEGNNVAELMNMAFRRRNLPLSVNCVANDTVGTLLSCAYSLDRAAHPECMIGIILGTGMNACYVEEKAADSNYAGKIINLECGNFNRNLPKTNVDYELDFADVGGRGRQSIEKMVSGAYLGEICRRTIVKIFQVKATQSMWQPGSLSSEDAATIIGDRSETLIAVALKCKQQWDACDFSVEELRWIRDICEIVYDRAAALSAMMIAGCAIKTGRLQEAMGGLTVGVDGSLFKCNQFFRDNIRKYLIGILGDRQANLVHLLNADDGSGLGAAILSAIATNP